MSENMSKGNGAGLVDFIDYAGDRGLMNPNTASGYKASTHKVLSIDDDWETMDVKEMDVKEQCDRFSRLMGAKYNPDSIKTYQRRFTKAVEMYLDWLKDPGAFKSPFKTTAGTAASNNESNGSGSASGKQKRTRKASSSGSSGGGTKLHEPPADQPDMITYPFPLRSGQLVYLQLPAQLPKAEAKRLAAFIDSLALDPQFALGRGSEDGDEDED